MKQWTYASSSGTAMYTAILADDGKLLCNCKGWTMRRGTAPRHCKHTKWVADALGQTVTPRGEFVYLLMKPTTAAPVAIAREADTLSPTRASLAPAPMLASAMTDHVTGAAFDKRYGGGDWVMEEKIDGHRCTVTVSKGGAVKAFSRPRAGATAANVRDLPPHIVAVLRTFPEGAYDGELVAPSGKAWDVVVVGAQLVLVLFDVLVLEGVDLMDRPWEERRVALLSVLGDMPDGQQAITTVEAVRPSWAGVQAIWKRHGEGVILKLTRSRYRPGYRTAEWVKVKQHHCATLTIIGFDGGKTGPYSKLKLRDASGHETTVKTLGNKLLADITKAPASFIGRRVVISYQEKTPSGAYRHGIFDHFAGEGE
jgi:ATP-dependent DNA ligase